MVNFKADHPNILEYIEEQMENGYSEDDAAKMWFCLYADSWDDDDDDRSNFPESYCEIEYDDMDSEEAVMGARFDDMNYLRYRER